MDIIVNLKWIVLFYFGVKFELLKLLFIKLFYLQQNEIGSDLNKFMDT